MHAYPILSLAIWLPILVGLLVLAIGPDRNPAPVRWIALVGSVVSFLVTIPLITGFDSSTAELQFVEQANWIERFNITYHLGVDGISMWFVLLTAFITVIVVISAWEVITKRVNQYMGAFLILSGLMVGVFCAVDGMLFYVFFEATLIPMYIIIGVWGGPNRVYAAFKFFLYTLMGSLLMLVALIYLYDESGGSFDIADLAAAAADRDDAADAAVLRVLPRLRGQGADVAGAHVVAGRARRSADRRLGRAGRDHAEAGRLRFPALLAADRAGRQPLLAPVIIALSLIAVIYIGLVALVQTDMKKLVAYSSIAHMGFVTLGFFIFNELGVEGAIVQMISHGFVSGAMFLCIGVLYDRVHSRQIADYGGVVNTMPKFAAFVDAVRDGQLRPAGHRRFRRRVDGDPGAPSSSTSGSPVAAATTLILGAAYTLWMFKRVYFGAVANDHVKSLHRHQPPRIPHAGGARRRCRCSWACIRSPSPT